MKSFSQSKRKVYYLTLKTEKMIIKEAIEIAKNKNQHSEHEYTEAVNALIKFAEKTLYAQELVRQMGGKMVQYSKIIINTKKRWQHQSN